MPWLQAHPHHLLQQSVCSTLEAFCRRRTRPDKLSNRAAISPTCTHTHSNTNTQTHGHSDTDIDTDTDTDTHTRTINKVYRSEALDLRFQTLNKLDCARGPVVLSTGSVLRLLPSRAGSCHTYRIFLSDNGATKFSARRAAPSADGGDCADICASSGEDAGILKPC